MPRSRSGSTSSNGSQLAADAEAPRASREAVATTPVNMLATRVRFTVDSAETELAVQESIEELVHEMQRLKLLNKLTGPMGMREEASAIEMSRAIFQRCRDCANSLNGTRMAFVNLGSCQQIWQMARVILAHRRSAEMYDSTRYNRRAATEEYQQQLAAHGPYVVRARATNLPVLDANGNEQYWEIPSPYLIGIAFKKVEGFLFMGSAYGDRLARELEQKSVPKVQKRIRDMEIHAKGTPKIGNFFTPQRRGPMSESASSTVASEPPSEPAAVAPAARDPFLRPGQEDTRPPMRTLVYEGDLSGFE